MANILFRMLQDLSLDIENNFLRDILTVVACALESANCGKHIQIRFYMRQVFTY